jgi:hypothetical protein
MLDRFITSGNTDLGTNTPYDEQQIYQLTSRMTFRSVTCRQSETRIRQSEARIRQSEARSATGAYSRLLKNKIP